MAEVKIPIVVDWEGIKDYLGKVGVVEVIRCRDCKYYDTYECMGYNSFYGLTDDDYCSQAERKDNG